MNLAFFNLVVWSRSPRVPHSSVVRASNWHLQGQWVRLPLGGLRILLSEYIWLESTISFVFIWSKSKFHLSCIHLSLYCGYIWPCRWVGHVSHLNLVVWPCSPQVSLRAGSPGVLFAQVSWRRKLVSEAAKRMGRGKVSPHESRRPRTQHSDWLEMTREWQALLLWQMTSKVVLLF